MLCHLLIFCFAILIGISNKELLASATSNESLATELKTANSPTKLKIMNGPMLDKLIIKAPEKTRGTIKVVDKSASKTIGTVLYTTRKDASGNFLPVPLPEYWIDSTDFNPKDMVLAEILKPSGTEIEYTIGFVLSKKGQVIYTKTDCNGKVKKGIQNQYVVQIKKPRAPDHLESDDSAIVATSELHVFAWS